jgi:hypothetical protein
VHGSSVQRGTRLSAKLDESLGEHSARGQKYTAKTVRAVEDEAGRTVIPAGSEITGEVVSVHKGAGSRPATIHLRVERLRVKGRELPIHARIVDTDLHAKESDTLSTAAEHGAEKGAIRGLVVGGPPGALLGGLSGALFGTIISLGLHGHEGDLPAGTTLTVRIEQSIPLVALAASRPKAG